MTYTLILILNVLSANAKQAITVDVENKTICDSDMAYIHKNLEANDITHQIICIPKASK